ncbi:DnaJ C-terminal domain-containing protein [Streptomyces sp. NPDC086993]|uniref:DnaJ C-terminal domain-containing protein n=1 Tax=Streptomyces sp. NPDC086993 TaxID=3365765 RepID=UPI00382681F1
MYGACGTWLDSREHGPIRAIPRTDETAARSCTAWEGEGRLIQWRHVHRARLPSGTEDGQKIRLRERGAPGMHGGAPGDLYVTVHVTS